MVVASATCRVGSVEGLMCFQCTRGGDYESNSPTSVLTERALGFLVIMAGMPIDPACETRGLTERTATVCEDERGINEKLKGVQSQVCVFCPLTRERNQYHANDNSE